MRVFGRSKKGIGDDDVYDLAMEALELGLCASDVTIHQAEVTTWTDAENRDVWWASFGRGMFDIRVKAKGDTERKALEALMPEFLGYARPALERLRAKAARKLAKFEEVRGILERMTYPNVECEWLDDPAMARRFAVHTPGWNLGMSWALKGRTYEIGDREVRLKLYSVSTRCRYEWGNTYCHTDLTQHERDLTAGELASISGLMSQVSTAVLLVDSALKRGEV
jgi:hypothetical protein